MLLGVDVGGTFTDAVLAVGGRLVTAKAPTTPDDQSRGVLDAVRAVLDRADAAADDVEAFSHGTTVATNALLEGRAARTTLVATAGFEDVVELGRQARADLYRLCAAHPAPLVPPERRVGADERMGPDGPLRELAGLEELVARVRGTAPEAVAVCLLHAYRHPAHEQAIGDALAEALPGVHVSLSHAAVGTFREHERAATTEVDAALSPLLSAYLRQLVSRAQDAGLPRPDVMQSTGGLADADEAGAHAATTVLSGPAGGAAGAAWVAGATDALCFDMGGTSCDVCVIQDGRVRETSGRRVGDRSVALPMLDLHTVGAGGGSIAWMDAGGALRVGPRSAGAQPGPACYGNGGMEPTVTDANLVLGLLSEEIAGGVRLDRDAAERAIASLGIDDAAQGIVDVANAEMVRALRVMTVERGIDPRDLALMPFGGAGPLHAAAIAEELGMTRIVVPRASGVLAALGLVVSERRRDVVRSVLTTDLDPDIGDLVAAADLGEGTRVVYEMRYRGQAYELAVDDPADFPAAHERAYGYRDDDAEVELVTVRVTGTIAGPEIAANRGDLLPGSGSRTTPFGETAVFDGVPERVEGPAIVELGESTLVVPPGWSGDADERGTLWMRSSSG